MTIPQSFMDVADDLPATLDVELVIEAIGLLKDLLDPVLLRVFEILLDDQIRCPMGHW